MYIIDPNISNPPYSRPYQTNFSAFDRVNVLSEALPYLQRFRGKTVVVKYGGAAMKDPTLKDSVVSDIVLLSFFGIRPVLVHGGGPEINQWLTKIGALCQITLPQSPDLSVTERLG